MESDSSRVSPQEPIESVTETRLFVRCLAASTASAYVTAVLLSYPLTAWSVGEARVIQNFVLAPFRYLPLLKTDLFMEYFGMILIVWLPPVGLCVLLSLFWVGPISGLGTLNSRTRALWASAAGAIASTALYFVLALNLDFSAFAD